MGAAQPITPDILILILKITPLIFSLLLDIFPRNFLSHWNEVLDQVEANDQLSFNRNLADGFYESGTIYVFDKIQSSNTLLIVFIYAGAIYCLAIFQNPTNAVAPIYAGPMLVFFIFAPLSYVVVQRWYSISEGARSPSRYHQFFVDKTGQSHRGIRQEYMRFDNPRIDRKLNPKFLSVIVQVLLIISIIFLEIELTPPIVDTGVAVFLAVIIALAGIIMFPKRNS